MKHRAWARRDSSCAAQICSACIPLEISTYLQTNYRFRGWVPPQKILSKSYPRKLDTLALRFLGYGLHKKFNSPKHRDRLLGTTYSRKKIPSGVHPIFLGMTYSRTSTGVGIIEKIRREQSNAKMRLFSIQVLPRKLMICLAFTAAKLRADVDIAALFQLL